MSVCSKSDSSPVIIYSLRIYNKDLNSLMAVSAFLSPHLDLHCDMLKEVIPAIRSTRLRMFTADAIYRNICCSRGLLLSSEPLCLQKIVGFILCTCFIYSTFWLLRSLYSSYNTTQWIKPSMRNREKLKIYIYFFFSMSPARSQPTSKLLGTCVIADQSKPWRDRVTEQRWINPLPAVLPMFEAQSEF